MKGYFHLCADGRLTRRLIICDTDYYATFNAIGIAAALSDFTVLAFSFEESHPHVLGYGTYESCQRFKILCEIIIFRHIVTSRGGADGVVFKLSIIPVDSESYLKTVGTYVISQPTKDGKIVMPYDYKWGTGSMYFRPANHIPIWCFDSNGRYVEPFPIGQLSAREQARILHSKRRIPQQDWTVCNGLLLPGNYVDVAHFERIYQTHNCFRAFMSSGKNKDMEVLNALAIANGIALEDKEAIEVCKVVCPEMFGENDTRRLTAKQRLALAQQLKKDHMLSKRQLATLVRLPEEEIFKYIK